MTVALAPAPDISRRRITLRIALAFVALLEMVNGLHAVALAINHMPDAAPLFGFLMKARFMTNVALALGALGLAASGYVRSAIVALALIFVMTLLVGLPFLLAGGFTGSVKVAIFTQPHFLAFPMMAAIAALLAFRNRWLWLATVLLAIPSAYSMFWIVMLAGVLIGRQ